jgi:lipopolysaccharide export system protein LptA
MTQDRAPNVKLFAIVVAATVLAGATALPRVSALAQPQGPSNALQGFSTNRDKPVNIKAASLEVRDKEKVATFSGGVHVVQGDTDMRCKTLVVYYEDDSKSDSKDAVKTVQPGPAGNNQIRRMEARDNVVVIQKDQVATGDRGDFDMRTNTVVLTGKVVVTKGKDVLRGERLVVNLTDGVSKMEGGRAPIEAMFEPKSKSEQKSEQKSDQKSDQKSASGQPSQPARKK